MKMKLNPSHLKTVLCFLLVALFVVPLASLSASKQVSPSAPNGGPTIFVTATAGDMGPTGYTTLGSVFAAINNGTHQGDITVSIQVSSTETGPAVLNSSGAGSASYTSVLIRPTNDGVTLNGATPTGRGLIELNGADNVTIDGDNPNTAGTNRNLTIQNTAANTITFTSVVRIALATATVTTANNDTIRNCNLIGNATGRNIAGATSTTGTENTVFGVVATAGASTTVATNPPAAITSISTTIGSPATATNLTIDNNSFATVARGISINGAATTVFPGLAITNNTIGNATPSAADQVYSVGMTAQGSANGVISLNTVYVEGFLPSSTSAANRGIDVGSLSTSATFTIERNQVSRVKSNAPDFWLGHGINLGGGNNHIVRNNFVHDITVNTTSGGFYSTTFNAAGIRVAAGTGHQIYHNSVNMTGTIPGATPTITACLLITSTTSTGVDARNNILVNSLTGGGATSAHVAVYLPSGGTAAMNLTLNNNDYFNGAAPTATQGVGQVGTTAGTGFFTQANFDPSTTAGTTNFRNYTSTLSASGSNDSNTKKVDPQFVSATDLHIAVASPMVDMGANVGVVNDIDGQNRVPPPDIGADEPSGITPPANDIAATAIITPAPNGSFTTGTVVSPQASFTNAGTAAQAGVMVQFTITGPGGYNYSDTQTIANINPNQTIVVTFAPAPAFNTPGNYNMSAAVTTPDAVSGNDTVLGTFTVLAPLAGTYSVPGDFASLTNNGGIFAALNAAGASANITINITADLTGETGTNALNELAGGFTVLIKPSGAARTITGSNGSTAIIRINGADGVTIDGATSGLQPNVVGQRVVGGDPSQRSLTIQNTSTTATAAAVVMVTEGTNGAQNVTIKNCNILGQDPTQTLIGIHIGGNAVGTAPTTANNNNARVENCSFKKAFVGIFDDGISAANAGTGHVLTQNDLSATGANRLRRVGIFMFNLNGVQVTENSIGGISTDESADGIGIVAGIQNVTTTSTTSGGIFNAVISRNKINGVAATSTVGFSAVGIAIAGDAAGANTISNNMISGVISPATSPDLVAGIFVAGVTGSNTKVYANSVSMTGDRGAVASQIGSYAIAISGSNPIVDLKDNIFFNTQTSGGGAAAKSYALGMTTTTATMSNLSSNYNDLFTSGANASFTRTGSLDTSGTDQANLGAWQAASGKDPNSISADPLFVSTSDLHLTCGSPALNAGTPIGVVTVDFDGQARDAALPDIGADEVASPLATSIVSQKIHGAAGPFNIPLPGIESRSTGGNHTIIFTFATPVTVSGAAVTTGTGVAAAPTGSGTNTITVGLSGVTNAQNITVTLTCVNDGLNFGDVGVTMGVLAGDVSAGGSVNGTDVSITKLQSGQLITAGNFREDINANGSISGTDVSIAKLNSGTALPP
jgi:hypothetical protein